MDEVNINNTNITLPDMHASSGFINNNNDNLNFQNEKNHHNPGFIGDEVNDDDNNKQLFYTSPSLPQLQSSKPIA